MLRDFFVTKVGMTQAWTRNGRRLAVTRCQVTPNLVVGTQVTKVVDRQSKDKHTVPATILEIGYGTKKLKNVAKPLRSRLEKSGFSFGIRHLRGTRLQLNGDSQSQADIPAVGSMITVNQVLEIGDVVHVQGVTKGKGFTGAMKRHGFHGGPATHGQSDRARAVGSIGAGTTPGKVWKGKKMPGHSGVETKTVTGLVVIHLDPVTGEVWLSGPVPGHINSSLRISKTGSKKDISIDFNASGLKEATVTEIPTEEAQAEETAVEAAPAKALTTDENSDATKEVEA
jgi:large subunit ribosomal protein L3